MGAFLAGSATRLCETVLRPRCKAGPIGHSVSAFDCIGHCDVHAYDATNAEITNFR